LGARRLRQCREVCAGYGQACQVFPIEQTLAGLVEQTQVIQQGRLASAGVVVRIIVVISGRGGRRALDNGEVG
jgi:hypothetical protein